VAQASQTDTHSWQTAVSNSERRLMKAAVQQIAAQSRSSLTQAAMP
jgi:hypothetical protein